VKERISETRTCDINVSRNKLKPNTPFIDTHAYVEVSWEQWGEWRNLPAFMTARRIYDEAFWQRQNLPQEYFPGNAKLPKWPCFLTTDPQSYIEALRMAAPLQRALLQNVHDRWLKLFRVIRRKYVRDFCYTILRD